MRLPQHRPRPLLSGQYLRGQSMAGLERALPGLPRPRLGAERQLLRLPPVAQLPGQRHAQLARPLAGGPPVPFLQDPTRLSYSCGADRTALTLSLYFLETGMDCPPMDTVSGEERVASAVLTRKDRCMRRKSGPRRFSHWPIPVLFL